VTDPLVLLDLVWPHGPTHPEPGPADWRLLDQLAGQHRLRPLLHQSAAAITAPAALRESWHRAHQRSALRALRQRAALARIAQVLTNAGITATVLKGGALVWRGWFDPALRPLRDLDLLIAPDQIEPARRALIDHAQHTPLPGRGADHKHAPPLRGPTGVTVELHQRLIDTPTPAARDREAAWRHAALARAGAAPGLPSGLTAFADSDALLHLIVHAALDHQFNNGPLLIGDLAALIRHGTIDWPLLHMTARSLHASRACALALALTAHWQPDLALPAPDPATPAPTPALIRQAARTMLPDTTRLTELGWAAQFARHPLHHWPAQALTMLRRRVAATHLPGVPGVSPAPLRRTAGLARSLWAIGGTALQPATRRHWRASVSVARWLGEVN